MTDVLEITCTHCQGRGGFADDVLEGKTETCHECGGSGFVPTSLGARILELVRPNSRVTVSAELRVSGAASYSNTLSR